MNPPRAVDPLSILRRFAPGTPLRTAAELVVRQGTGALVLLASGKLVDAVSSGGFMLRDAKFTAQRIAELAKMDAGIVVSGDCQEILRANVHFIPDSSIQTSETGTRFRTAERLAKQTGFPVLAISEEGRRVAVVFTGDERFVLKPAAKKPAAKKPAAKKPAAKKPAAGSRRRRSRRRRSRRRRSPRRRSRRRRSPRRRSPRRPRSPRRRSPASPAKKPAAKKPAAKTAGEPPTRPRDAAPVRRRRQPAPPKRRSRKAKVPFKVGDKVVYPHHGAATVVKKFRREHNGVMTDYFELEIATATNDRCIPNREGSRTGSSAGDIQERGTEEWGRW